MAYYNTIIIIALEIMSKKITVIPYISFFELNKKRNEYYILSF